MATNYYTVKGRVKWAKVYEPDEYAGAKRFMLNFYPFDGKEWEKIQKSGLQSTVKEDTDGKYVVLRRPAQKLIGENLVVFSPPEITGAVKVSYVDKEGNKVRSYNKGEKTVERQGDPIPIGNGSVVLVNFCVYDTRQGKGGRLENINVLDLVVFEPNADKANEAEVDAQEEEVPVDNKEEGDKLPW